MRTEPPMMMCGHAANATAKVDGVDVPCCVICSGISGGAHLRVAETPPDLTGRTMRCSYNHGRGCPRTRHGGGCCQPNADGSRTWIGLDGERIPVDFTRDEHGGEPSNPSAAFFEHRPGDPFDRFYCGCWGWD